MAITLSTVTGKVVWQYTPSPTLAFLVSMVFLSWSNTSVPAGTVTCLTADVSAGELDCGLSDGGVCAAAARPAAITKAIKLRIVSPPGRSAKTGTLADVYRNPNQDRSCVRIKPQRTRRRQRNSFRCYFRLSAPQCPLWFSFSLVSELVPSPERSRRRLLP